MGEIVEVVLSSMQHRGYNYWINARQQYANENKESWSQKYTKSELRQEVWDTIFDPNLNQTRETGFWTL